MSDENDNKDDAPTLVPPSAETRNPPNAVAGAHATEGHSNELRVGGRDRGMGRMDYAVLDGYGGVVAELKSVHVAEIDGAGVVVTHHAQANAHLFAASPDLYAACTKVYAMLLALGAEGQGIDELHAALKKANPGFEPEQLQKPKVILPSDGMDPDDPSVN